MDVKHMSCALRVKSLGGDGIFTGYASVFGELDQQNEIVAAGAFARTLSKWRQAKPHAGPVMDARPDAAHRHLAKRPNEDGNGLHVEGRLALRTQKGGEAYELLKLGALTGLSIGYRVVASQIDAKRKARILTDVDLFEISLVTFPRQRGRAGERGESRKTETKYRGPERYAPPSDTHPSCRTFAPGSAKSDRTLNGQTAPRMPNPESHPHTQHQQRRTYI
jgi:HK97 family phage prohead protease